MCKHLIQEKRVPLLDLRELCGGHAYTSSHLRHHLTGQRISQVPARVESNTYEQSAVHMLILPNKLIDVAIVHPLANRRKPVFTHGRSE